MKKIIAIAVCACALGLNGFAADAPAAKCDQNCPKASKDCKKECKKDKKCDKKGECTKKGECPKKAEA